MTLVCRLREDSPQLRREWNALLQRVEPRYRIFAPAWYAVWAEAAADRHGWTGYWGAVEVRAPDGTLVGLLPLAEKRLGPVKLWATAGEWQPWRSGLFDPQWEQAAGSSLGRFLASEFGHLVRVGPTPAGQTWYALAMQRHASLAGQHLERRAPLAVCRWTSGWERYDAEIIGAKANRKIDYYERRLRRNATVRLEHFCNPETDALERIFDDLARIERNSWLATAPNGRMRFATPYGRRFWPRIARELLLPQGMFDCWILYADAVPASFCFTITSGPVRFVIANQYDEAFKPYRTGSQIYRHMIRDGLQRGVTEFDFGDGELHYKKHWGAAYLDTLETRVCLPSGTLGKLFDFALRRFLQRPVEDSATTLTSVP